MHTHTILKILNSRIRHPLGCKNVRACAQAAMEDPSVSLGRVVDMITALPEPPSQVLSIEQPSRPGITSARSRNPSDFEVVFAEFLHMADVDEEGNTLEPARKVRPVRACLCVYKCMYALV